MRARLSALTCALLLAVAVFLVTSFVRSGSRLFTPYYLVLLGPLLWLCSERVLRKHWFRAAAMAATGLAILLLILNPSRPLFPARTMLSQLRHTSVPTSLLDRAERVYTVYSDRATSFARAAALLPPDTQVVGMVTYDDPETAMWKPFGHRRLVHVCRGDDRESLKSKHIDYIWVGEDQFRAGGTGAELFF